VKTGTGALRITRKPIYLFIVLRSFRQDIFVIIMILKEREEVKRLGGGGPLGGNCGT
jgi:hypothetical protein